MSTADRSQGGAQTPLILAPYHGAGRSRTQRTLARSVVPLLVLFCLIYGLAFALFGPFMLRMFPIPLVILALVTIWALPDLGRAPTGLMSGLFFAFTLGLILWPNYLAIALPGLPWITVVRLIGAPMAIIFLICLSVSRSFRSSLRESLGVAPWVWRLTACFAVLQVVAIGVSENPYFSLQKVIDSQITWTCIFFISAYVFLKRGRATLWAALLCLTLIPMCLIGLWEHALGQVPWANHIPSFLKVEDESVQRILAGARRLGGAHRVQGTFSTPLGLGEYVALTVPFVLHFVAGPYRMVIRLAAAAILPVTLQVVLSTDSRLGLIGFILSFLLFGLFYGMFWWRRHKDTMIGPAVVLAYPAVLCAAFAATLVIGRVRNRIWGSGQYAYSNQGRSEMYQEGIPMILQRPWGYGPGMGGETLGFTNPSGVLTIDTYYLLIGLEYGIVGFALYYGALAAAIYCAGKTALKAPDRKSEHMLLIPLAVSLTNFFVIKAVFSNDDNHPLAFMMMGMVLALVCRFRQAAHPANDIAQPVVRPTGGLRPAAIAARRAR